ncbi:tetratricopeptide repeat protein [Parasphingorhabdus sp.]|uniref:tetratricopeptide repeat protein n=1 Tax=Parasphingorhabdus sp. TaxID=2709688 RepID=UPI003D2DED21
MALVSGDDYERRLRQELETVLQSPDFLRSPVMSKLLTYLVDEAIANPDNPPKAYQVATDGLGRAEDFDVQADSYPRVQVGRLRKLLASHYARQDSASVISIPMGVYAIDFEPVDRGADERTASAATAETGQPAATAKMAATADGIPIPVADTMGSDKKSNFRNPYFLITILLGLSMIALIGMLISEHMSGSDAVQADPTRPPKLYILTPKVTSPLAEDRVVSDLNIFLGDAFSRSSHIRLAAGAAPEHGVSKKENAYSLHVDVFQQGTENAAKFSVVSLARGERIWSTVIPFAGSVSDYPALLGPVVGRIAGVYGAIANDQRRYLDADQLRGYACVLRFDSYRTNRDAALLPVVDKCILDSLQEDPQNGAILAAASFMSFLREQATGRKPDPETGAYYATRALLTAPDDATANFAVARAAFFSGSCVRGKEFAQRAVAINPYDADFQAQTGAYLFACDDPGATKYLRQAIALDPRGSIIAETAMVFTLVAEGKDREALLFAEKIVPSSTGVGPYYDLAMAMVYAKNGEIDKSRESWRRLKKSYGNGEDEKVEELLSRVIVNDALVQRATSLLRSAGVVTD